MKVNRREFLEQAGWGALQLGLMGYLANHALAEPLKTSQLPRSAPEAQAVRSSAIFDFVNAVEAENLNLHSLMVLRHGKVLAEGWWAPYAPGFKHTLYSLSKSFTSSAIGHAVAEGRLTVDDKVISFFPNDVPATISEKLGKMRVRDLLTMSTGHAKDSTPSLREPGHKNWVKSFLAQPVERDPGTFFVYNSGATYMLSAIIEKVTGQSLIEYLTPRLFKPLGIEGMDWEVDPNGINTGGWGLRVKTEDIAKFGQLYLQKGVWNGKQILSEKWVNEASSIHIQSKGGGATSKEDNDWQQGYGYQFWRCRHDAYRGDGAYGQYCIVMPKQDMVIAITSETSNMGAILNHVWKHILPGVSAQELSTNRSAQQELKQKLSGLAFPVSAGSTTSGTAAIVSGKSFAIAENSLKVKSVSLSFVKDVCTFTLIDDKGTHQVMNGIGKWKSGKTDLSTIPLKLVLTPVPGETRNEVAALGIWKDENSFEMTWRFVETAHYDTVTCVFKGDDLSVEFKRSLAILGNSKDPRPVLYGKQMT
jgi:CubicO group peptidase (beta-lactamase class C family)